MTAILFPEAMCLVDPVSGQTSWGANQEWYGDLWQRKAGCGPTAAASLIFYQMQKQRLRQREALYLSLIHISGEDHGQTDRSGSVHPLTEDDRCGDTDVGGIR